MNPVPPHFIIEEGPERGRELLIPADGARIGRADENDIQIADASMSRFQCRAYFKDHFLHVMDLGSTNATLVNDVEISDSPLRHGDHVLIGESLLRVVNDGLSPSIPEAGEADLSPASSGVQFQPSPSASVLMEAVPEQVLPNTAAVPGPAQATTDTTIDLFGKQAGAVDTTEKPKQERSALRLILVALAAVIVVFGAGLLVLLLERKDPKPAVVPKDQSVQIYLETIRGDTKNIFRYALTLEKGILSADIHDLVQKRDFQRSEALTDTELKELREELTNLYRDFRKLQPNYDGASGDRHDVYDLTVILGRNAHRVRVENQLEPDIFQDLRERIEMMADTKLGLSTIQQPVEVLLAEASRAWEVGNDLYDRRNVQDDNLWKAIKKMKEIAWLVESIEPKPDYYQQAVKQQHDWEESLESQRRELMFAAQREARIHNYNAAIDYLSQFMAVRPDPEDKDWKRAQKYKVQLEQHLN